jgi:DNA-binding response OmpR family regulator
MAQRKLSTVLLVEADNSLRRIIALGLRQRGMHVVEANSSTDIPLLPTEQADVLVLDIDSGIYTNWALIEAVRAHSCLSRLPLIVLAWEHTAHISQYQSCTLTALTYIAKPFDARTLHDTIEQILRVHNSRAPQGEEALLATYAVHTSPSIWPLITAAGLLLAFAGMLFHIAVTAIGLLILVAALMLWTLERKSEQEAQMLFRSV